MTEKDTLAIIDKIFNNTFQAPNNLSLTNILSKFAFDIKLPKKVYDTTTNEETWADSINSGRYITLSNMAKKDKQEGWLLEKKSITNLDDLINIWNTINLTTTERVYDSVNVSRSDTIYNCVNVYHSTDCRNCQNIIYCDSCGNSEFLLACQRTASSSFCIRADDSRNCSNSYNIVCSNKIINSLFIQDSFDLYECLFCSHISSKKYCIANMQFVEEEYFAIKKVIINWILNS